MTQKLLKIIELEEPKARLERFLSFNNKRPNFLKRNLANALGWNVIAVLNSPKMNGEVIEKKWIFGGEQMHVNKRLEKLTKWIYGHNEITNDGEIGYAQQAATETPAANEDFFRTALSNTDLANPAVQNSILATDTWNQLDNPAGASIAGSRKIFDAAYPKRNDGDSDNTGAGVDIVSFLTSYTTGDFNDGGTTIKNFGLLDDTTPVAATKLLTHGQIAAFNKTASDTLKFFVNHEQRRV